MKKINLFFLLLVFHLFLLSSCKDDEGVDPNPDPENPTEPEPEPTPEPPVLKAGSFEVEGDTTEYCLTQAFCFKSETSIFLNMASEEIVWSFDLEDFEGLGDGIMLEMKFEDRTFDGTYTISSFKDIPDNETFVGAVGIRSDFRFGDFFDFVDGWVETQTISGDTIQVDFDLVALIKGDSLEVKGNYRGLLQNVRELEPDPNYEFPASGSFSLSSDTSIKYQLDRGILRVSFPPDQFGKDSLDFSDFYEIILYSEDITYNFSDSTGTGNQVSFFIYSGEGTDFPSSGIYTFDANANPFTISRGSFFTNFNLETQQGERAIRELTSGILSLESPFGDMYQLSFELAGMDASGNLVSIQGQYQGRLSKFEFRQF